MSDALVSPGSKTSTKVEVEVLTEARPIPGLLRVTRTIIQRTPALRSLFMASRSEGWSSPRLAQALFEGISTYFDGPVPEDPANVRGVAEYLADEYAQLGDSILLVSADTGRAIARLNDQDFYQPVAVPREDGTLVLPGHRIRPELEALLVQWQFDRGSEARAESKMLSKLPRTTLLTECGDRRALFATRHGRKVLTSEIGAQLPHLLPKHCKGSTRTFCDFVRIVEQPPAEAGYTSLGKVTNHATASYPLVDKRAKNLRYDVWSSILATTASGWVRRLASLIVLSGRDLKAEDVSIGFLQQHLGAQLWVCSPNVSIALASGPAEALPVGTSDEFCLGFQEPCGYVVVDESSYEVKGREVFDLWEVATSFRAEVWVNWDLISRFAINDVPTTGLSFEVIG